MMKSPLTKRILSLILALTMILSMTGLTTLAADGLPPLGISDSGEELATSEFAYCHPVHDTDCGYIEAAPATPCGHFVEDSSYSCAFVDADEDYVCAHDDNCGFAEIVDGVPCTHTCEQCADVAFSIGPMSFSGGTFTIANPNGSLQTMIETDLQTAPFNQTPGSYDYTEVTNLTITGDMTNADFVFIKSNLTSLVELDISGVTSDFPISRALEGCRALTTVKVPQNIDLEQSMFVDCTNLTTLSVGANTPTPGVIDLRGFTASYNYPGIFDNCTAITQVVLPADADTGGGMFARCTNLTTLSIGANTPTPGVIDLTGFTASYGLRLFLECPSITTVKLPAEVDLSQTMFRDCTNLTTLSIGASTPTPGVIDLTGFAASYGVENAFYACPSITTVKLPDVAISNYTFANCTALAEVQFTGATAPSIGVDAFYNINASSIAYVPDKTSGGYQNTTFTNLFNDVRSTVSPTFTTHPQPQTTQNGGTAVFTAAVSSEPAANLLWQMSTDGGSSYTDLAGETGATLTLATLPFSYNGYQYRCVAKSIVGEAFSNAATLTVQSISATPTATTTTVTKTAATQATAVFTLTNSPAYADGQTWIVYNAVTGVTLATGVTASNVGNSLTLTHGTDIPAGTYYVSVTEAGKVESARIALTVNAFVSSTIPVTGVTLSPTTLSLYSNTTPKTGTLSATVAPSNATNKAVTWSSSNTSVATVANGVVMAVGNGTATITVTTVDGNKTATCVVTVTTYSGGGTPGNTDNGSSYTPSNTDTIYRFISGANNEWCKGSTSGHTVEVDASYNKFYGVSLNGYTVASTNWTAKSGSTIVTLKPEYLETLSLGKHTLRIRFSDGYAETSLTILAKQDVPPNTENPNTGANNPFTDVQESDWFFNAVMIVYDQGLFAGTSAATFSPNAPMTRGMFATVLVRLDGVDLSNYNTSPFDDVAITEYYARPIAWSTDKGIVTGVGDGKFAPNKSITREEMAVMLANYIKVKGIVLPSTGDTTPFADNASVSTWAQSAVADMKRYGLIQGVGGNRYNPQGTATRAEVAQIFLNLLNALEK